MPKKRKSAPKQTSIKFLVVLVGLLILSLALLITIKQKQSTSPLSLNQLTVNSLNPVFTYGPGELNNLLVRQEVSTTDPNGNTFVNKYYIKGSRLGEPAYIELVSQTDPSNVSRFSSKAGEEWYGSINGYISNCYDIRTNLSSYVGSFCMRNNKVYNSSDYAYAAHPVGGPNDSLMKISYMYQYPQLSPARAISSITLAYDKNQTPTFQPSHWQWVLDTNLANTSISSVNYWLLANGDICKDQYVFLTVAQNTADTNQRVFIADKFGDQCWYRANDSVSHELFFNQSYLGMTKVNLPPTPPSPTPSSTPAPSPTPRPTPSPTPQPPVANQAPIIKTGILPTGIANIQYSATIAAYDSDSGTSQGITITASGLPTGLSLKPCFNRYSGSTLTTSCTISGKPIRAGSYQVTFKATDWQGASSIKTLPLNIVKSNPRIIPIDPRPTPVAQ